MTCLRRQADYLFVSREVDEASFISYRKAVKIDGLILESVASSVKYIAPYLRYIQGIVAVSWLFQSNGRLISFQKMGDGCGRAQ